MQLGIDFGTCNSSAACMSGEKLVLIKDPTTQGYSIPSSVFVTPERAILVGKSADNQRQMDPSSYRRELKRELGHNDPLLLGNYDFQPEELIGQIVGQIKREADRYMQTIAQPEFTGAILTIPATYDEYKRNRMRQAVTIAGFIDEQVTFLEEPVAAAWYYAHMQRVDIRDNEIILVYDLGGGTFDTALLQKRGLDFIYCSLPDGLPLCGGVDFDQAIYQDLLTQHPEVQRLLDTELDEEIAMVAKMRLLEDCIKLKHQLSDLKVEDAAFPIIVPGMRNIITYRLKRSTFNQMIEPTLCETIVCCRNVVQRANIQYKQINHILLVGGSCRIPYVQQMLQQEFKHPIHVASDMELIVCQGAAIHGEIYKKGIPQPDPVKKEEKKEKPARLRPIVNLGPNKTKLRRKKEQGH